ARTEDFAFLSDCFIREEKTGLIDKAARLCMGLEQRFDFTTHFGIPVRALLHKCSALVDRKFERVFEHCLNFFPPLGRHDWLYSFDPKAASHLVISRTVLSNFGTLSAVRMPRCCMSCQIARLRWKRSRAARQCSCSWPALAFFESARAAWAAPRRSEEHT